jgi:ATP synthase protein I
VARRSPMGDRKDRQWLTQLGMASTVGITLVVATGIGYFFGSWLDSKLGTGPYLMLLFTLLGVAAGFYEMLRLVIRLSR